MQYARAETALHNNQLQQAVEFNEQALTLNPTHARILFQRFYLVQQQVRFNGVPPPTPAPLPFAYFLLTEHAD